MTERVEPIRRGRPPQNDRRPQIIRAARDVLANRGYAHASLKQIAEHAGIATGLLNYYYPSKQALLLEVITEVEQEFIGSWRTALDSDAEPIARIEAAFDRAIGNWSQQPELFQIFYDLSTLASVDDVIRQRIQELLRRIRTVAAEEMLRITAELPTPPPQDSDFAAAITAGFHGALFEALTLGEDPRQALSALRFMVLSTATMSYVAAGQTPPIALDRLADGTSEGPVAG